jgi:hypothetical protein
VISRLIIVQRVSIHFSTAALCPEDKESNDVEDDEFSSMYDAIGHSNGSQAASGRLQHAIHTSRLMIDLIRASRRQHMLKYIFVPEFWVATNRIWEEW